MNPFQKFYLSWYKLINVWVVINEWCYSVQAIRNVNEIIGGLTRKL